MIDWNMVSLYIGYTGRDEYESCEGVGVSRPAHRRVAAEVVSTRSRNGGVVVGVTKRIMLAVQSAVVEAGSRKQ